METGTKIQFSNEDGYQFETSLDENKTSMQVHISRENNTLFQSTLSISTPIRKNSKTINNKTSVIFNDTDKAYYCSLSDADSHASTKAMVLGGLGVFYGFLGLVASAPGMPFQFGLPIAAQGMILAVGALADGGLSSAGEPVRSLLLPGRRIFRKSENGIFSAADNAVTITRISIERKIISSSSEEVNVLFVRKATHNLSNGETNLSKILSDIEKWGNCSTRC